MVIVLLLFSYLTYCHEFLTIQEVQIKLPMLVGHLHHFGSRAYEYW